MERHPGGAESTLRLLELAGLDPPCRIIDLAPGPDVLPGDILDPPFEPTSFDAALSQCAFYLTGAPERALEQAARLLRPGGRLLYADVCAGGDAWLRRASAAAGFDIESATDDTEAWKRYYIAALWRGEAERPAAGARNCRYLSAILKKRRSTEWMHLTAYSNSPAAGSTARR